MNHKCDHEENRRKVCAPCGRKIVFGKRKPESFLLTEKLQNLVKNFVNTNYDISDQRFPISICNTCRLALLDREKNNFKRHLQQMPNYEDLHLRKETRVNRDSCNCYICLTGRYFGHAKIDKGKGHVRNVSNAITTKNGLHAASDVCKLKGKTIVER